jgi:hypothetical protein
VIPFLGLFLWLLAGAALIRILLPALRGGRDRPRARTLALWVPALVLATLVLFRPHEQIFGGQDPGAYINSALAFARHGTLFHTDPLLGQVAPGSRREFLYGHAAFAKTKDACLWVHDLDKALIGPWFQPAYSVLMSPVAKAGFPDRVLYVAPLLTLLTALILAILAARLIRQPGAPLAAFLLMASNPVVAWNGRCPRAEAGAAFFLLAGCALILTAYQRKSCRARGDLLLGLACAVVAPFFHVTAWFPVLGLTGMLTLLALRGRPEFLLALPVTALAAAAFLAQARFITDCYFLWPRVAPLLAHPGALGFAAVVGGAVPVCLARRGIPIPPALHRFLVFLLALAPLALCLILYFARPANGQVPFLSFLPASLFTLTDIRGLVRLISPVAAAVALLGWLVMVGRWDAAAPGRRWVLAALLPGLLFTGWMDDYMMETRRLMIVPAPVIALCLAAAVTRIAEWLSSRFPFPGGRNARDATSDGLAGTRLSRAWIGAALTLLVILAMTLHKPHLYTLTEYRGARRFLKPFADLILKDRGILLAEYSPTAAPFEHRFGIPVLSLDSDRRTDYREAESAWLGIMTNAPSTPAFFLTPYTNPVSAHFEFEWLYTDSLKSRRLPSARRAVPDAIRNSTLTLHLYRMRLRGDSAKAAPATDRATTFVRRFEGGNMGLRRFANQVTRPLRLMAIPLPPDQATTIAWRPEAMDPERPLTLRLFVYHRPDPSMPDPTSAPVALPGPCSWIPLADGWSVARVTLPPGASSMTLTSSVPDTVLNNVLVETSMGQHPLPLLTPAPHAMVIQTAFPSRWARTRADLLLPVARGLSEVYVFIKSDTDAPAGDYTFDADGQVHAIRRTAGAWEWRGLTLKALRPRVATLAIRADKAWNPGLANFPADLALQFGYVVALGGEPPR